MNFKVKTHNAIAESGLTMLTEASFSVSEEENDPDAIILRSYKLPVDELNNSLLKLLLEREPDLTMFLLKNALKKE